MGLHRQLNDRSSQWIKPLLWRATEVWKVPHLGSISEPTGLNGKDPKDLDWVLKQTDIFVCTKPIPGSWWSSRTNDLFCCLSLEKDDKYSQACNSRINKYRILKGSHIYNSDNSPHASLFALRCKHREAKEVSKAWLEDVSPQDSSPDPF